MSTMSFVDLATLALHRRHEMEARINVLATKCDQAITDISKLKLHAKNFVHQLNCEPSELKERFLNCMKQLDEYIYLITDFTLSIENLGTDNIEYTPVHDTRRPPLQPLQPLPAFSFNIMDVLSEPAPTASTACPNLCPVEKPRRKKVPKEEQSLIVFSSASCSSESVPARAEKHVQCAMSPELVVTAVDKMTVTDIPSFAPHGPTSSSNRPTPSANRPTSSTNGPTSTSHGPTSTSHGPTSTSHGPTSTSHGSTSSSNGSTSSTGPTPSSHRRNSSPDALSLRNRAHNHSLPRSESASVQEPTPSQASSSDCVILPSKGSTSSNGSTLASNGSTLVSKGPTSSNGPSSATNRPTPATNGPTSTSNGPTSSPDGPTTATNVVGCDINLPAQTVLQTDQVYQAIIMHVDGAAIWIITDDPVEVYNFTAELTSYCKENRVKMAPAEIESLNYCAFYDEDGDHYYRGLFIRLVEDQIGVAEVFLVDTGEVRCGSVACLQPLPEAFCTQPPYARCAHLAGVELEETEEAMEKYEEFLKKYVGAPCSIEVDDNTSESLGVYIRVNSEWLHEAAAARSLARGVDAPPAASIRNLDPKRTLITGPAELVDSDELDITNCPEYEDPVEAVTGHRYRDEADICKHYKGGPERTCFKGTRCTKRHVLMHPDGWTLDRVPVAATVPAALLPAPGTWHLATVTCVKHFDRLYAQFKPDKETPTELPSFGVMMPPATLDALVRDMNSPASRIAYKPLKLRPAMGELVAAKYPMDEQWYRARVTDLLPADHNVQVRYIDYGNEVWVKEDAISSLEPRYCVLPAQATTCVLAGAAPKGYDSKVWAKAKQALTDAVQDRTLRVHIIARDYDEVTVEILDEHGYSIAEQLAAKDLITLTEYQVIDDTNVKHKVTVP